MKTTQPKGGMMDKEDETELVTLVRRLATAVGCSTDRVWTEMVRTTVEKAARRKHGNSAQIHVEVDQARGRVTLKVNCRDEDVDARRFNEFRHGIGKRALGAMIDEAIKWKRKDLEPKVGTLVEATVRVAYAGQLELDAGGVPAMLAPHDLAEGERYRAGDRLVALCTHLDVRGDRVHLHLSRREDGLIRRLVERHVPAVQAGTVDIHAIARVPGRITQVMVAAQQAGVDPVAACCAGCHARLPEVEAHLPRGERVKVLAWTPDLPEMVRRMYAEVCEASATIDRETGTCTVLVPDLHLPRVETQPTALLVQRTLGLRRVVVLGGAAELARLLAHGKPRGLASDSGAGAAAA